MLEIDQKRFNGLARFGPLPAKAGRFSLLGVSPTWSLIRSVPAPAGVQGYV